MSQDVLLILTDGLSEVFDAKGNELGLDAMKLSFSEGIDLPLEDLFERLRRVASGFGRQTDDQSALLARFRR